MASTLLAVFACGDDQVFVGPEDAIDGGSAKADGALTPGDSAIFDTFAPTPELPGSSLALGEGFGCIVASDHTVYCWGRNDFGQLGVDPATTPSCGSYPCNPLPQKVEGLENVSQITAGKDFACALVGTTGWCWGNNSKGQLQVPPAKLAMRFKAEKVTEGTSQIVAGGQHACILDKEGFVLCWGDNECDLFGGSSDGGAVGIISLAHFQSTSISLGPDSMCTVRAETGEAYCWGADHKGSLGHPISNTPPKCNGGQPFDPSPKRVVSDNLGRIMNGLESVHVGSGITCFRKTDGTVLCAGDNTHGGLGQGLPDGDTHFVPMEVPALKAAKLVVAGESACAITTDKLLCWGDARYGTMDTGGVGTDCGGTGCRPLGYVIPNQIGIRDLAMSSGNIGTIKNDVSVWVWGRNDSSESGVAKADPTNGNCGGVACIGAPRQFTNIPPLK